MISDIVQMLFVFVALSIGGGGGAVSITMSWKMSENNFGPGIIIFGQESYVRATLSFRTLDIL